MNIKPLADRVLIEPAPAETKTVGGIIIPDGVRAASSCEAACLRARLTQW